MSTPLPTNIPSIADLKERFDAAQRARFHEPPDIDVHRHVGPLPVGRGSDPVPLFNGGR